jgi:hypothetical protein
MSAPEPRAIEPVLRLRPLGLGELLDDIFRIYRRHFGLLFVIALLLSLPILIAQIASGSASTFGFLAAVLPSLGNPRALAAQQPPSPPNLGLLGITYLVILAMLPLSIGAVTQATLDLAQGNPVSVQSAFGAVVRRYLALFGQALLVGVTLVPLFLCFPVAIWLAVRWVVAVPALLAENIGPVHALSRSWTLTRGSWWRLFGTLLIIYLLQIAVSGALGAVGFPISILIPFVPPIVRGSVFLTISALANAVTLPVVYLGIVLLYFDLRIRQEGFDLDQLARQAAATSSTA